MVYYLNEIVVYKDINAKEKYIISVDPSEGYGKALLLDPYFKVYKGKSYIQSNEDIRFYLKDGHADKHNDGKKLLKVNNDLIDFIADILKSPCTNNEYTNLNIYDAIWKVLNDYAKSNHYKIIDYIPIETFLENFYAKNYK